jgi:hypothetical protein
MVWKFDKFQSVYNVLRFYVETSSPYPILQQCSCEIQRDDVNVWLQGKNNEFSDNEPIELSNSAVEIVTENFQKICLGWSPFNLKS